MAKAKKGEKILASRSDYSVLRRAITTEKTTYLGSESGAAVAFEVHQDASKVEVKKAVERVFEVEVAKVRVVNLAGKTKRTTRSIGRTRARKKAYVTLKAGHSIDVYEGL